MKLVECVPNFSSGRDAALLDELVEAVESVPEARVLDRSQDPDHDRAVLTFAAPLGAVGEAAFRAVAVATRRIDLRAHRGVHPRIGATDVCPFVPLDGARDEECVRVAHELGRRVGQELELPVFFYGEAARKPDRRALPALRRGGLEGLRERVARDPDWRPDEGPASSLHPTAGAVAIGVRAFLVAFNVDLETRDLDVAREIAARIREANGGLPGIRALGLPLARAGCVQVSVNVCDYRRTGLIEVFEAIREEARRRGVAVRRSELVGLAPRAALDEGVAARVRLEDFDPRMSIVEERLRERGLG